MYSIPLFGNTKTMRKYKLKSFKINYINLSRNKKIFFEVKNIIINFNHLTHASHFLSNLPI